jgi:hypothetical protein
VKRNRGVALILALLVLSFLTILGGALLTTSTIDIWISDNYKTYTQAVYVAEAGVDSGRYVLATSGNSTSNLLLTAAGPDHVLSTSTDLATLLASDDQPLIPADPALRSTGQPLVNDAGEIAGHYYVWLRNDNADGMASINDTNQTLTLMCFGSNWGSKKAIEATVRKGAFPDNPADPRLYSAAGLQGLAASVARNATDVFSTATITNYGSPVNYRVAVVNGNTNLGPGTGYGILLIRGNLNVTGNFVWNGLIVVVGPGAIQWNGYSSTVNGGMFAGGVYTVGDPVQIALANRSFPYTPIAIQER